MSHFGLRIWAYRLAKAWGLTALGRRATRRGLRILCYHGFSLSDEHLWSPSMFMSGDFFRRRMEIIAESGMPVVPLDAVLAGDYPDNAVAITIDDGWEGTLLVAAPILREFGFPATVYSSSYYSQARTQVFNVLADYLLSKTSRSHVHLPEWSIDVELDGRNMSLILAEFRRIGHTLGRSQRQRLADALATALDVDATGLFYYVSLDQLQALDRLGMDLQLHTHRHQFHGLDCVRATEEITANREFLNLVRPVRRSHFCYPSGMYTADQLDLLTELDIHSATTCEPGLNYPGQDPLRLYRLLDSQAIPDEWFKALLDGLPFAIRNPAAHLLKLRNDRQPESL